VLQDHAKGAKVKTTANTVGPPGTDRISASFAPFGGYPVQGARTLYGERRCLSDAPPRMPELEPGRNRRVRWTGVRRTKCPWLKNLEATVTPTAGSASLVMACPRLHSQRKPTGIEQAKEVTEVMLFKNHTAIPPNVEHSHAGPMT